jgi:hypothetical protein
MKAIQQTKDLNLVIISHLYLLLCWNLIARCVSIGGLMYDHVSWVNDSMVFVFPAHKGDQEELTDVSFGSLPPHFLRSDGEILTSDEWNDILPGYSTFYPLNFREVIPYLLASLIYHQPYLASFQETNPRHPLFLQRVWTSGILVRLKDLVGAGCNSNPISKLTATGVPPHLVLASSIIGIQKDMETMKEDIISKLDQLPEALKYAMLDNFTVQGTVPITRNEMHDMMRLSIEDLKRSIETSLAAISVRNQSVTVGVTQGATVAVAEQQAISHYTTWRWGGDLHPVPEHFEFPVYVYFHLYICLFLLCY